MGVAHKAETPAQTHRRPEVHSRGLSGDPHARRFQLKHRILDKPPQTDELLDRDQIGDGLTPHAKGIIRRDISRQHL
jgi:hypothetical protein